MKRFSTMERALNKSDRLTHVQLQMRSESDYNIETCEFNTPPQTRHCSSAQIYHVGTTHPADSDTTRWDRHP